MDFLKRFLGSEGKPNPRADADPNAIILYIKVKKCGAIARVRVDKRNDLSVDDDGESYVVRKQVMDNVCYGLSELEMHFDGNHQEVSRTIENGEFVTRADWELQESLRIAPHKNTDA
ncbi:MAG TPA: hypothetical protein VGK87_06755 [Anaerolineae bacterium]|jgi:hypothetical protein